MKLLIEIPRYLVGGLFIFSGLIKVNDPIGTAIKLQEYFEVFSSDIAPFFEWFVPASLFFSIVLSVLEVVLGIALLLGYKMNITSWVLLVLIIFFSFLTFYSAYFNKVTDCGCFGDAIKLTPWQSFIKDIILLVLIAVVFVYRRKYQVGVTPLSQHIQMGSATVFFVITAIFAINHLPYVDFRSYAVGNHLPTLMQPSAALKYKYIMEKDGKEYSFDSYPADKSYTFKSMDLVNPEAQPKITDLSVWNDEGEYTHQLMEGNKLLIIIHNVEKASRDNMDAIRKLANNASSAEVWVLTSSGREAFESFRHEEQLAAPYFFADATVLKTMIRSNPGIILLGDGTVKGKWHHNDTPETSAINQLTN